MVNTGKLEYGLLLIIIKLYYIFSVQTKWLNIENK